MVSRLDDAGMSSSLRNQVRLAAGTIALLWFLSHTIIVGAKSFLEGWEFWTLLIAVVNGLALTNLLARRAVSRYLAAITREDLPAAKDQYEMMRDFGGPAKRNHQISRNELLLRDLARNRSTCVPVKRALL